MESSGQFIDHVLSKSKEKQIELHAVYFRGRPKFIIPVIEIEWQLGNCHYSHTFDETEFARRNPERFAEELTSKAQYELQQLILNARRGETSSVA